LRSKQKYEVSINLLKKCDEKSSNNILTLNKLDNRNNYTRLIQEEIEDKLSEDEKHFNINYITDNEKINIYDNKNYLKRSNSV